MERQTKIDSDEINLVDLIQIIWKGKWMIVAVTVIAVGLVSIYLANQPNNFEATTDIEPINISEENKYLPLYNIVENFKSSNASKNDNVSTNLSSENSETFSLQNLTLSRKSFLVFY